MLSLLTLTGCHFGALGKRCSEKHCPTDIRQTIPGYIGEDAVFRHPCGPSAAYFGYKPTCWGVWPTSAEEWRDTHCGPAGECEEIWVLEDQVIDSAAPEPLPVRPGENVGWVRTADGHYCAVPAVPDKSTVRQSPPASVPHRIASKPLPVPPPRVASPPQAIDARPSATGNSQASDPPTVPAPLSHGSSSPSESSGEVDDPTPIILRMSRNVPSETEPPTVVFDNKPRAIVSPAHPPMIDANPPTDEPAPTIMRMSYTVATDTVSPAPTQAPPNSEHFERIPYPPVQPRPLVEHSIGRTPRSDVVDPFVSDEQTRFFGPAPTLSRVTPAGSGQPSTSEWVSHDPWADESDAAADDEPSFSVTFKDDADSNH